MSAAAGPGGEARADHAAAVAPATGPAPPPLVLHLVFRFDTGGLENGLVNLLNRMPRSAYRHAVVALTEVAPAFRARVLRDDVEFLALHKPPGHALRLYPRLLRLFRALRPAIVHTRNLAALECQVPAWLAGVPVRIHGEHGRDVGDLDGSNRTYRWLRRAHRPFVDHWVALSADLRSDLEHRVGVPAARITQLGNGVDSERFRPLADGLRAERGPFEAPGLWRIGTVGRMQPVKAQTLLARAFVQVLRDAPALAARLRLVLVGAGPLRDECAAILEAAGCSGLAWLPGDREDVPEVMRGLDCFVLPSLAEGISNTILEAMASGLPVLATEVGGNPGLVQAGVTGELVTSGDVDAMAAALRRFADDPARAAAMGAAGREVVERRFALASMVDAYRGLYDRLLARVPAGT